MTKKIVYRSYVPAVRAAILDEHPMVAVSGDSFELIKKIPTGSIDLIFSSPPYCMGKQYENTSDVVEFTKQHAIILPELVRILRPGGSLCWQVGNHTKHGVVTPLDALVIAEMVRIPEVRLRNRVIWTVAHGLHCTSRFSGRHESVLWYTKGEGYTFNLDDVRVPQKYPGKTHTKGPNKGKLSGNPLGKNPGDVWEIPNVKANHIEKTDHPCQFPVALPQIFIRALTNKQDLVFDPFMGSASTGVAALIEGRRFLGCEINEAYIKIAETRLENSLRGTERTRAWDQETYAPSPNSKVARRPAHFVSSNAPTASKS